MGTTVKFFETQFGSDFMDEIKNWDPSEIVRNSLHVEVKNQDHTIFNFKKIAESIDKKSVYCYDNHMLTFATFPYDTDGNIDHLNGTYDCEVFIDGNYLEAADDIIKHIKDNKLMDPDTIDEDRIKGILIS